MNRPRLTKGYSNYSLIYATKEIGAYWRKACYAKKRDNFLVEADIFTILGVSVCNMKRLQFNTKKQEHKGTV